MHVRELKKIQKFSDIIKKKISKLESSLKKYQKTKQNLKANLILKELNNLTNNFINDTPTFLVKLDNFLAKIKARSKNSSKQKEFRYSLKITSSRIQWMLNELRQNNVTSDSLISQLISKYEKDDGQYGTSKYNVFCVDVYFHLYLFICFNNPKFHLIRKRRVLENRMTITKLNLKYDSRQDTLKSINRNYFRLRFFIKIVLYDSNLKFFEIFIEYLYSGHFDSDYQLNNTELIGLLTLADKYECRSLKYLIEHRLINSLESFSKISDNHEWILDLIDIIILSEQFDLKNLMNTSVDILTETMSKNDVYIEREEFKQLHRNLIKKIEEKLSQNYISEYNI
ncbi:hypothetical protein BpHYR1_000859 [Brachionus plicatilis]|uniref:BTB domain-containing protein n=1 Tax=Brachionus plicatilis TaxID=10195 RepID=A0A3M7S3K9_BRAPC|nr:hypothetical protein BpHYR1_000859 [Brachionus plicatilis]